MPERNASDAAREAFRLLAARKLVPTPENYAALFAEASGSPPKPPAHEAFAAALSELPGLAQGAAAEAEAKAACGEWRAALAPLAKALSKAAPPAHASLDAPGRAALLSELHEQIARLIEFSLPALGEDDPKIGPDAAALAAFCRENASFGSIAPLKAKLAAFNHRLSFVAEDQAEIRRSLLGMLRSVFENIAELSLDDRWLRSQVEALMQASTPPLSLRRLDDLERRLRDVIFKQSELKRRTVEAQEQMKSLLAAFLERLSGMAESSGSAHQRIEACAKKIESAKGPADIGPAIAEAIGAARSLAAEAARARDELAELKRRAELSQCEISKLRRELDQASSAARHDPLTGALNRKGLSEAIEREASIARRRGASLCVGLLDIDDFKTINDVHGHPVGDAALAHLAQVAREAMRPQDTLSRFGGEEFVILMPDTSLEGAASAMERLQRELTRRFFMAGSEKLLITFSAGVAELAEGETPTRAIERADGGMYQAKRSGKNKVVAS